MPRSCPLPRVVPDSGRFNSRLDPQDANHFLPGNTPEVQLGSAKQTIDDQEITANAEADELQFAIGPEHEERRQLTLGEATREDDINPALVIEDRDRSLWRVVALRPIAMIPRVRRRDARRGGGNAWSFWRAWIDPRKGQHPSVNPRDKKSHGNSRMI